MDDILCGMVNDADHDYEWKAHVDGTPTPLTGPPDGGGFRGDFTLIYCRNPPCYSPFPFSVSANPSGLT